MTKDKQIKEMAKDLGIAFQLAGTTRFGDVAEVLVNAGYRKSTDLAREIFELVECAFSPALVYEGHTVKAYLAELKKEYTEEGK
jgi:hypothetical protein